MELKVNALLLRAADWGESDRILTLFTAERGKMSAKLKGVKNPRAKLSFAAQPFCFAEYVLSVKGERATVTGAALHDGFYPLRERIEAFYAAAAVLEASDKLLPEGVESPRLFFAAVGALKEMAAGDEKLPLVRFLLTAVSLAGYPVRAEKSCPVCGAPLAGALRFELSSGEFRCGACPGTAASEVTYRLISDCLRGAVGAGASSDGVRRAVRLLSAYLNYQTELEIRSLTEYIRLL